MNLDVYQEKIANDFEGKIAVVAGPGSGKTRTLIERAYRIYNTQKVDPGSILIISFTNKVRREIKERLKKRNGALERVKVHTFHSFGANILRKYGNLVGINEKFLIIDNRESEKIIHKIYEELGISQANYSIKDTFQKIRELSKEKAKEFNKISEFTHFLNYLNEKQISEQEDIYDKILYSYVRSKRNNNYLDFDDIIIYANALLEVDEKNLSLAEIKYIMVDEAQDLSVLQYDMVKKFRDKNIENILLVGDFDQNIYSWRGAKIELFKDFYNEAKKYDLKINYRSTPAIVRYSKNLIEHNTKRIPIDLISNVEEDNFKPMCYCLKNDDDECNWISSKITELLKSGVKGSEIAILYRANYLSERVESNLRKHNINYIVYNDDRFFDREEIKDCLGLLKLLINKEDKMSLSIVLPKVSNIGLIRLEKIFTNKINEEDKIELNKLYKILDEANEKKLIVNKLIFLIDTLNYKEKWNDGNLETRMENYSELLRIIEKYDTESFTLTDFLDNIYLENQKIETDNIDNCVRLMTIHSSKGLEFKYIFIRKAIETVLPNLKSIEQDLLEEERRLTYVGITRAKKEFYITASPAYKNPTLIVSRFVDEAGIEEKMIED